MIKSQTLQILMNTVHSSLKLNELDEQAFSTAAIKAVVRLLTVSSLSVIYIALITSIGFLTKNPEMNSPLIQAGNSLPLVNASLYILMVAFILIATVPFSVFTGLISTFVSAGIPVVAGFAFADFEKNGFINSPLHLPLILTVLAYYTVFLAHECIILREMMGNNSSRIKIQSIACPVIFLSLLLTPLVPGVGVVISVGSLIGILYVLSINKDAALLRYQDPEQDLDLGIFVYGFVMSALAAFVTNNFNIIIDQITN